MRAVSAVGYPVRESWLNLPIPKCYRVWCIKVFGFRGLRNKTGFVYKPEDDLGEFLGASPGDTVSTPSKSPPYIVVNHDLAHIIMARWPGQLWRVRVLERVTTDFRLMKATRAWAVEVLEPLPSHLPFGPHGSQVAKVIDAAGRVSIDDVAKLASERHEKAREILTRRGKRLSGGHLHHVDDPWSVIGPASSLLGTHFSRRAEALVGDCRAFAEYSFDPEGAYLVEPWSTALDKLYDIAYASGAPDLFSDEEKSMLMHGAWSTSIFQTG